MQIKTVMLDSANDSVADLKMCLAKAQHEAAQALSDSKMARAKLNEVDVIESSTLRCA